MGANDIMAGFEAFSASMDAIFDDKSSTFERLTGQSGVSVTDQTHIGKTYNQCVDFINKNSLFHSTPFTRTFAIAGNESSRLNAASQDFNAIINQGEDLKQLCIDCGIVDKEHQKTTCKSLATILQRFTDIQSTVAHHWASGSDTGETSAYNASEFYGNDPLVVGSGEFSFSNIMIPGQEAFGAQMDAVIPDVKAAMTVVLLKPWRGITENIFHKRTIASPIVRYAIAYDELFDLSKSQDEDGGVRNSWLHRTPMIAMFRSPNQMVFEAVRIHPLAANDPNGEFLVVDDVLKFNTYVDLFDMARDATDMTKADATSFVADGVALERIHFSVKRKTDGKVENFVIPVKGHPKANLFWTEGTDDSADRATQLEYAIQFNSITKTKEGNPSEIFALVANNNIVYMDIFLSAKISRKTSVTYAHMDGRMRAACTMRGITPSPDVVDLVNDLELEYIGYEIDARRSEENVRMSSLIVRTNTFMRSYELPATRNFLFDYSINQAHPEKVLDSISTLQQIGCDHRSLKLILNLFETVHTQGKLEAADPLYRGNTDNRTLNMRYAAGSRVNPHVIVKDLKLTDVIKNIRSSDNFGDIHGTMDSYFTKLFSELHSRSLYSTQLNHGERPTYKCITSIPILENLLQAPHIHNHLNSQFSVKPGDNIITDGGGFTRVLPSGVKLSCHACTFDYMRDIMLFIPYRENDPESVYNFAHNYDYGTFVAHYMPIVAQGVNKRMLVNVREFPIPTNAMGICVKVIDLDETLPNIVGDGEIITDFGI